MVLKPSDDGRDSRNPPNVKKWRASSISCLEHFLQVNGCDLATAEQHILAAYRTWKQRQQYQWQVDYGEYA